MKQLEKLKAFCDKEGFQFDYSAKSGVVLIYEKEKEKDPWEGVEFVECVADCGFGTSILKINDSLDVKLKTHQKALGSYFKDFFKPSTETAYIEQLKKEFEEKGIRNFKIREVDISMMYGGNLHNTSIEFKYRKDTDTLYFYGVPVYQQGKWAKKLPQRIEVQNVSIDDYNVLKRIDFSLSKTHVEITNECLKFISKQLEAYLNGEIGKEVHNG